MRLIEPTMEYDEQIQAYRREFLEAGGSMDGCGSLRRYETTQEWLDQVEALKRPETTPIRHCFNEFLEKYAGHIGYSVCPTERRKGYATQMLRLVLPECKALGIDRVLISCVQGNEGSKRTILHNGGVYESTVFEPKEGVYLERYWIDIRDN